MSADALCGSGGRRGAQPWDAILGINGIRLDKGEKYRLSIIVSGDPEGPMRAIAQKGAGTLDRGRGDHPAWEFGQADRQHGF
jgi:hypothetical protein